MIRHIKHAVRHSGFVQKHPIMTFVLAAIGISTIGKIAMNATAPKASSNPTTGA